jgi:hypothetical protein
VSRPHCYQVRLLLMHGGHKIGHRVPSCHCQPGFLRCVTRKRFGKSFKRSPTPQVSSSLVIAYLQQLGGCEFRVGEILHELIIRAVADAHKRFFEVRP